MTKRNGDWQINHTEKIFGNDFFTVFQDDVIDPAGEEAKYATIHLKKSVAVIALDDANNVYLTEQFRYALGRKSVEVIAGAIDDESEKPLESANRELKEEVGITAKNWDELGSVVSNTSLAQDTKYLFLARDLSFAEPERETTEQIETLKYNFTDALEKAMNGAIDHDLTCLLLLKAERFLTKESGKR